MASQVCRWHRPGQVFAVSVSFTGRQLSDPYRAAAGSVSHGYTNAGVSVFVEAHLCRLLHIV